MPCENNLQQRGRYKSVKRRWLDYSKVVLAESVKEKIDPYFIVYTKRKSRCIGGLNVEAKL